jgi:hypothetical protein
MRRLQRLPLQILVNDAVALAWSLDQGRRQYMTKLVDNFNQAVKGNFDMIDKFTEEDGCNDFLTSAQNCSAKKWRRLRRVPNRSACRHHFRRMSQEQVDRFERGLAFALKSNPFVVKEHE